MMRRRFGTGILVVAFVGALLSGCGSNEETATTGDVSPQEGSTETTGTSRLESPLQGWASGLCTSIADWQASTKATGEKMANSKDDFAQGEQAVTSADDILVSSLKGLGTPPAPASAEAKNAFAGLLTKLEDEGGEIEQALVDEPRTQSEVVTATARVKALTSKMESEISKTVTELKSLPDTEGWKAAFSGPYCRAVASG